VHYLGCFDVEGDAARAYDAAALEKDGHQTTLNFPSEEGQQQHQPRARKSQYRGVCWCKQSRKWQAQIQRDGKHHLGYFEVEEDAARAFDAAALERDGHQALLSLPSEGQQQHQPRALTSQYRGVCWDKQRRKWIARITRDGKKHSLGYFEVEEDAAKAYDAAALEKDGHQAALNFPSSDDGQHQSPAPTSQDRGVSWDMLGRKWKALIQRDRRTHYIGHFEAEEDAAKAYDAAALENDGHHAALNFAAQKQGARRWSRQRRQRSQRGQRQMRQRRRRRRRRRRRQRQRRQRRPGGRSTRRRGGRAVEDDPEKRQVNQEGEGRDVR
jgi:hypothetical protein